MAFCLFRAVTHPLERELQHVEQGLYLQNFCRIPPLVIEGDQRSQS